MTTIEHKYSEEVKKLEEHYMQYREKKNRKIKDMEEEMGREKEIRRGLERELQETKALLNV